MFALTIKENNQEIQKEFENNDDIHEVMTEFLKFVDSEYNLYELYFELGGIIKISFIANYGNEEYEETFDIREYKLLKSYLEILERFIYRENQNIIINFID